MSWISKALHNLPNQWSDLDAGSMRSKAAELTDSVYGAFTPQSLQKGTIGDYGKHLNQTSMLGGNPFMAYGVDYQGRRDSGMSRNDAAKEQYQNAGLSAGILAAIFGGEALGGAGEGSGSAGGSAAGGGSGSVAGAESGIYTTPMADSGEAVGTPVAEGASGAGSSFDYKKFLSSALSKAGKSQGGSAAPRSTTGIGAQDYLLQPSALNPVAGGQQGQMAGQPDPYSPQQVGAYGTPQQQYAQQLRQKMLAAALTDPETYSG